MDALRNSRGFVNHSCPRMPKFLDTRPKQRVTKELENEKVWYENQILLNKLTKIDKRAGRLNPYRLMGKYYRPSLTHVGVNQDRHYKKVAKENSVNFHFLSSAFSHKNGVV